MTDEKATELIEAINKLTDEVCTIRKLGLPILSGMIFKTCDDGVVRRVKDTFCVDTEVVNL